MGFSQKFKIKNKSTEVRERKDSEEVGVKETSCVPRAVLHSAGERTQVEAATPPGCDRVSIPLGHRAPWSLDTWTPEPKP